MRIVNKLTQVQGGMSANFVLQGERGIGKTALSKLVMHIARANSPKLGNLNLLTTYYSVEKGQHFRSVLQSSINQVTDQLPTTALTRLSERVGSIFKNGKFSFGAFGLTLGVDGKSDGSEDKEQFLKDQAVSAFTNILSGLNEKTGDSVKESTTNKNGILIVIDEIHNLEDLEGVAQILRGISTTLDVNNLGNLSFLIIGYTDAIESFFQGDPSARRSFDPISLDCMPEDEAVELIEKGLTESGLKYSKDDLAEFVPYAGGYPHCLQIIGHHVVEADQDGIIDRKDWEKALDNAALELQTKDFSNLYNFEGKTTLREEIMNSLALIGDPVSKTTLANTYNENGSNIYSKNCLPQLKQIGAVKENTETGELRLQSLLFRSAILLHLKTKDFQSKPWEKIVQSVKGTTPISVPT